MANSGGSVPPISIAAASAEPSASISSRKQVHRISPLLPAEIASQRGVYSRAVLKLLANTLFYVANHVLFCIDSKEHPAFFI